MINIQLSDRQEKIIEIVKEKEPVTSEEIAKRLKLTRATLRPDLAILTMAGILDARPKVGYFYSGKNMFNVIYDQINDIKVSKVKSVPVIVNEETTVYDAIVTMFLEDVGTIFVVSDGLLSGVISRKDFLKSAIGGIDINKVPVGIIMTRMPNIVMASPEESILDAAVKIMDHEVDSLPIVEEVDNGKEVGYKVIGRISKTNITRIFVDLGKE
ncbi:helix-turn-helix transcriptional regulator [Dethiothermospora halolimnae]|uniref:helix-turn-helix transcriptional regulator n=1 Tax=Dethiothermospora halolimnae TaxID=3114390 RepID=UPI003CCBCA9C